MVDCDSDRVLGKGEGFDFGVADLGISKVTVKCSGRAGSWTDRTR